MGTTTLIDRSCVVKSITFMPYDTELSGVAGPVTANVFDGSTELFTLAKQGLPNFATATFSIKLPVGGLRIENSFKIEVEGASTAAARGVTILYQPGSNDDVA